MQHLSGDSWMQGYGICMPGQGVLVDCRRIENHDYRFGFGCVEALWA
jgi:hypothetical protein